MTQDDRPQRVRDLEQIITDFAKDGPANRSFPRQDKVRYQNALEQYLRLPAAQRRILIRPDAQTIKDIYDQCSPLDPNDAGQVEIAKANKARWSEAYPHLFLEPQQKRDAPVLDYEFDEEAARDALANHLAAEAAVNARIERMLAQPADQRDDAFNQTYRDLVAQLKQLVENRRPLIGAVLACSLRTLVRRNDQTSLTELQHHVDGSLWVKAMESLHDEISAAKRRANERNEVRRETVRKWVRQLQSDPDAELWEG